MCVCVFTFLPPRRAKQSGAVQVLLQHGADLLTRNERVGMGNSIPCPARSTPLHLAAMRGHIEISRLLLKSHYERVMEPLQLSLAAGERGGCVDNRAQLSCGNALGVQWALTMSEMCVCVCVCLQHRLTRQSPSRAP